MGEAVMTGLLKKTDTGWFVTKGEKPYRVFYEDAVFCLDEDHGTVVEFYLVRDEIGNEFAKLGENTHETMSWEEIEEWYSSDNYPPFGGPFTDAMKPFEWLKLYFSAPKLRQGKTNENN